jgi:hypothetical protein
LWQGLSDALGRRHRQGKRRNEDVCVQNGPGQLLDTDGLNFQKRFALLAFRSNRHELCSGTCSEFITCHGWDAVGQGTPGGTYDVMAPGTTRMLIRTLNRICRAMTYRVVMPRTPNLTISLKSGFFKFARNKVNTCS